MENNIETPALPTKEQKMEWEYKKTTRHLAISRMRAIVLRNQITDAYTILENIRFDHLGDTAFRDKITVAKKGLESAISDFLLDDNYWKEAKKKHQSLTPKEYHKLTNDRSQPTQCEGK